MTTFPTRALVIRGSQKWVDAVDAKAEALGLTRQAFLHPVLEKGVGLVDDLMRSALDAKATRREAKASKAPKATKATKATKKGMDTVIDDSTMEPPKRKATKKAKAEPKAKAAAPKATKAPAPREQKETPAPEKATKAAKKIQVGGKAKTKAGSPVKILAVDEAAGTVQIERLLDGRKATMALTDLR